MDDKATHITNTQYIGEVFLYDTAGQLHLSGKKKDNLHRNPPVLLLYLISAPS